MLSAGTRLGPYEIVAPLGAGGMGEVYRGRDTRLGRDVAIKVLAQHLSRSAEVRARFEREAKTVSALNHPHICTLHDVGREGDTDFLIMELVEGETLTERIARGPLPAADALRIGGQIADALDRAHRAGVVHRDLKPGNVMLTKSGAKLLDFGLARASNAGGSGDGGPFSGFSLTQSPTMAQPLTAQGTLVGTFQYMAPEQLEGKEADARSDVWALGCVLYEMVTGRRAFDGQSQASLITAIMGTHPTPIAQIVPIAPPALDRLVQACLAKEPADRLQSAHDIRMQLAWIAQGDAPSSLGMPAVTPRRGRERLAWGVASVAALVAIVASIVALRPHRPAVPIQASLVPPAGVNFASTLVRPMPLAISLDGSRVAYCARAGDGPDRLWLRTLGEDDAHPLAGTEGAQGPFFAPDGRAIAFFADGTLKRVDVTGGPVTQLAEGIDPRGGSWNRDGDLLFTRNSSSPILRIAMDGGPITAVTTLDTTAGESTHRYPCFLPDGRHFLYLARRGGAGAGQRPTIFAGTLGSTQRKAVLEVASNIVYASGYLLYIRGTALVAQRFDVSSLSVSGPAVPLVDDACMDERFSRGTFAASENGVLLCMTGNAQTRSVLRWIDRSGKRAGDVGEPANYTYGGTPQISQDGKLAVLPIGNEDRGFSELWILDLTTGLKRKLTLDGQDHAAAIWHPDGRSVIAITHAKLNGGMYALSIDGMHSRCILPSTEWTWPMSAWGDRLLYTPEIGAGVDTQDVLETTISGGGGQKPFADSAALEYQPQFSPDGRWVAYVTEASGRPEIVVAAYPQPGGHWQVSQDGGTEPRWNRNGRELFYVDRENFLVSVDVDPSGAAFQTGASRKLFQVHGGGGFWRYDVAPDGQRFLVGVGLEDEKVAPVTLITDWTRRAAQP